jgi:hypothetical protein
MDAVTLLVVGLLVMATLNAASLIWAFYLDHRLRNRPDTKNFDVHVEGTKVFKEPDLEQIESVAEQQLQVVVQEAAARLQQSLNASIDGLAGQVAHIAESTVSQEFEKYKVTLQELESQSVAEFGELDKEIQAKRAELLQNLEADVAKERDGRMDEFNARLNDVVSSYLAESLGNNVDLGAQSVYIMQMLETHKEDIKRDVLA